MGQSLIGVLCCTSISGIFTLTKINKPAIYSIEVLCFFLLKKNNSSVDCLEAEMQTSAYKSRVNGFIYFIGKSIEYPHGCSKYIHQFSRTEFID